METNVVLFLGGCKPSACLTGGRMLPIAPMKTKSLIALFVFLVGTGIFFTIKFGLKPRPLAIIDLSSFGAPTQFAEAIEFRLREEIKKMPVLIFGYQPERPNQLEIIKEFIRTNTEPGMKYDTVVADENLTLPPEVTVAEKIDSVNRVEVLASGLKAALEQNRRILILLPTVYSTQMLGGNVADILRKQYQVPFTSFSIVELPRTREEEKAVSIPCITTDSDTSGPGVLGCAALQTGRMNYRKKREAGKWTGLMDQRGASDFLIFYSNQVERIRE